MIAIIAMNATIRKKMDNPMTGKRTGINTIHQEIAIICVALATASITVRMLSHGK